MEPNRGAAEEIGAEGVIEAIVGVELPKAVEENEEPNDGWVEPNDSVLADCCVGCAPNSDGCDVGTDVEEVNGEPNTLEVGAVGAGLPNRELLCCGVEENEKRLEVVAVEDVGCDPNVGPNDGTLGVEP